MEVYDSPAWTTFSQVQSSIIDNNKAVAFSFGEVALPEVLQNISTPQTCKTGWESWENEFAHKIQAIALLGSTVCLLSLFKTPPNTQKLQVKAQQFKYFIISVEVCSGQGIKRW